MNGPFKVKDLVGPSVICDSDITDRELPDFARLICNEIQSIEQLVNHLNGSKPVESWKALASPDTLRFVLQENKRRLGDYLDALQAVIDNLRDKYLFQEVCAMKGKRIKQINNLTIYYTEAHQYAVWTPDGRCWEDRLTLNQAESICSETTDFLTRKKEAQ